MLNFVYVKSTFFSEHIVYELSRFFFKNFKFRSPKLPKFLARMENLNTTDFLENSDQSMTNVI